MTSEAFTKYLAASPAIRMVVPPSWSMTAVRMAAYRHGQQLGLTVTTRVVATGVLEVRFREERTCEMCGHPLQNRKRFCSYNCYHKHYQRFVRGKRICRQLLP